MDGSRAARLTHTSFAGRFREGMGMSDAEVSAFGSYMYHISAARGSGEFALPHLLGPFAWARLPLDGRLHELKVLSFCLCGLC